MVAQLPFLGGLVTELEASGIQTDTLRKSLDGTQAIIHIQLLSMEQFNAAIKQASVLGYSFAYTEELMQTAEWADGEE